MGPGVPLGTQSFINQRGPAVNPYLPGRGLVGGQQNPFLAPGTRPGLPHMNGLGQGLGGLNAYGRPVSGFNRGMMVGGGMLPTGLTQQGLGNTPYGVTRNLGGQGLAGLQNSGASDYALGNLQLTGLGGNNDLLLLGGNQLLTTNTNGFGVQNGLGGGQTGFVGGQTGYGN